MLTVLLHLLLGEKKQMYFAESPPLEVYPSKRALRHRFLREWKNVDKGYIGKDIFKSLWKKGFHLMTGLRKHMRQHLMPFLDKILWRKRFVIETTSGILKEKLGLEYTRHRSSVRILSPTGRLFLQVKKPNIKVPLTYSHL